MDEKLRIRNERLPPQTIDSAMDIMHNEELTDCMRAMARGYLDGVSMLQDSEENVAYYAVGLANALYSVVYQYFEDVGEEEGEIFLFDLLETVKWGL